MSFSQTFVNYHGCGKRYLDGTNELELYMKCFRSTNNPFWKKQKMLVTK